MSVSILIGISPTEKLNKNIIKVRQEIAKLTKENVYQESEPHITLLVNTFTSFSEIESDFKKILKKHKPFTIKCEGVFSFGYSPITKLYTLVYKIKKSFRLTLLQKELFLSLNQKRTDEQKEWLLQKNQNPPKKYIANLKKYGYVFGPDNWEFHATIGSVSKDYFNKMKKLAKNFDFKESWTVNEISIYRKRPGLGHHKFYKSYKLHK